MSFWKTWLVFGGYTILAWFFSFFLILGLFEFLGRPHTTTSESNCRAPHLLTLKGVGGFFLYVHLYCTKRVDTRRLGFSMSPGKWTRSSKKILEYKIVWVHYYNHDRPQWDLLKLAPAEYYQYLMTGEYPLEKIRNQLW